MSMETAKAQISKAIQGKAATRDTEVLGVGTTKQGYLIRFRTEKDREQASNHDE